jgi:hypothetical protein
MMRSRLQVVPIMMERERDENGDGDGSGGAVVPLFSDEMDLRSICDFFLRCLSVCCVSISNYIWVLPQKLLG